jgi:hypothetical protein
MDEVLKIALAGDINALPMPATAPGVEVQQPAEENRTH